MSKLTICALLAALTTVSTARADVTGKVEAKPAKFLKDSIVYVKKVDGQKLTAKTVSVDQVNMQFDPHIVLLAVGDTVRFQNHDKVDHNVMSPEGKYDLGTWGQGKTKDQQFKTAGVFSQICKIHPEMLLYVFVGQNRFSSIVDDTGVYKIEGLPAGTYELDIWNPKLKAKPQTIKVGADGSATANFSLTR